MKKVAKGVALHPLCVIIYMLIEKREKEIMTLFDVTVNAKDIGVKETFRIFATSKRHAMMKAMKMVRVLGEVKGELLATAKVVR